MAREYDKDEVREITSISEGKSTVVPIRLWGEKKKKEKKGHLLIT